MPVITALEVNQRNRERIKLCLDDELVMSVPRQAAARLTVGQPLSQREVDALADSETAQRAFERALRYLAKRPRSAEEVRRNLAKKKVADSHIAVALERLQGLGYLDDYGFAKYWLENRARFKPLGPRALRYELRSKGVADDIIETLLEDIEVDHAAYRVAAGKANRIRPTTRHAFRRTLNGLLYRRGFEADTIRDVVLRLERELEEEDRGYFLPDDAE